MSRPRLLDLFCGAGGAAMGYHRAGFDVVGVDIKPQPHYPFEFHQADAMTFPLDGFDVVHASPPCQDHSSLSSLHRKRGTGWMLAATIKRLAAVPHVVENVGAADLPGELVLCGSEFGLGAICRDGVRRQLRRHRRFASNRFLMGAGGCAHSGQPVGVYGNGGGGQMTRGYKAIRSEAAEALGIDWMSKLELSQAIPPAYCEFIGSQILDALGLDAEHLRRDFSHAHTPDIAASLGHKTGSRLSMDAPSGNGSCGDLRQRALSVTATSSLELSRGRDVGD